LSLFGLAHFDFDRSNDIFIKEGTCYPSIKFTYYMFLLKILGDELKSLPISQIKRSRNQSWCVKINDDILIKYAVAMHKFGHECYLHDIFKVGYLEFEFCLYVK
jgi:hypothetical protein